MMFFEKEYKEGKKNEDEHFDFLQEYFKDPTLKQTKKIFSTFDYDSDNNIIELKKRNFPSHKYPDLMIGLNKIQKAKKAKKDIYFIMDMDDGLFSYKFDINDELNYRSGGRKDRGYNEFKKYAYIPVELFTKIK
jgi:hypothetical protein